MGYGVWLKIGSGDVLEEEDSHETSGVERVKRQLVLLQPLTEAKRSLQQKKPVIQLARD